MVDQHIDGADRKMRGRSALSPVMTALSPSSKATSARATSSTEPRSNWARWGRLAVGYRADLVALAVDPATLPTERLDEIVPTGTWLGGVRIA